MGRLMVKTGAELAMSTINVGEIAGMMERTVAALKGASEIPLTVFKCPSGDGKSFACNDEDIDFKEIEGVIIAAHYTNVYWSTPVGEGNRAPDCVSHDGLSGWYTADGEVLERACRSCPYNRMGSGNGSKGKACKNKVRLLLLMEGQALPVEISVPTMSVNNYSRYVMRDLVPRGLEPWQVSTKVTLNGSVSSGGTKYKQMVFECTGRVDDAQMMALRERVSPLLMGGTDDE